MIKRLRTPKERIALEVLRVLEKLRFVIEIGIGVDFIF